MKKRLLSLILTACMLLGMLPGVSLAAGTAWDGTTTTVVVPGSDGVYTITTGAELAWVAAQVNAGTNSFSGKTIKLGDNIDLNHQPWTPIGTESAKFLGTFDGVGHTVANLTITGTKNDQGLFGYAQPLIIRNLGVVNCSVTGGDAVGAIVGKLNGGSLYNCYSTGAVTGTGNGSAGGIVGINTSGDIKNRYSTATVTGTGSYIGGIAGESNTLAGYYLASAAKIGVGNGGSTEKIRSFTDDTLNSEIAVYSLGERTKLPTTSLLQALNNGVDNYLYFTWVADSENVNGGYPVFGPKYEPPHTHGVNGVNGGSGSQTYTAWTSKTALPTDAGSYYLKEDVTLPDNWGLGSKTINLCLNGNTINTNGHAMLIFTNDPGTPVLNLCDCKTGGTITGGTKDNGEGAAVQIEYGKDSSPTVNMYGGKITGSDTGVALATYGFTSDKPVFNMYGGTITGNTTGIKYGSGTVNLDGAVALKGNTGADIKYFTSIIPITLGANFSTATPIGINAGNQTNGEPLTGALTSTFGSDVSLKFTYVGEHPLLTIANGASNAVQLKFRESWTDEGNYDAALYATAAGNWQIADAADFGAFAKKLNEEERTFNGFTVTLIGNIDLTGKLWNPIKNFEGTFDGGGHTISGMEAAAYSSTTSEVYSGLFATLSDATAGVRNLTVSGTSTALSTRSTAYAGGIVGAMYGKSADAPAFLQNCVSNVDVTATSPRNAYAGGIAGYHGNSRMINCVNNGAVTATAGSAEETEKRTAYAGGLAGFSIILTDEPGCINNSYNTGAVTATGIVRGDTSSAYAGGIVGGLDSDDLRNCYNVGTVSATAGTAVAGGIVGKNVFGMITGCYYLADSETDSESGTTFKTSDAMKAADFVTALNGWVTANTTNFSDAMHWKQEQGQNSGYPVLTAPPVADPDAKWGADASNLTGNGTLDEALEAKPAYIQLQKSFTYTTEIKFTTGSTTLDLNGEVLTLGVPAVVDGASTLLTVVDTSADGSGKITYATENHPTIQLGGGGDFTLNSGTVEHTKGANVITTESSYYTKGGTITIAGGTIRNAAGGAGKTFNAILSEGGFEMTGGTVESSSSSPTIAIFEGTGTISGGIVKNTGGVSAAIINVGATLNVSGGTLTGSGADANCYAIKNFGTLKLSNSPLLSGTEATLYTQDGASIVANNGTAYAGTAATVFYKVADQSADDVLVSGLTDAEHAKLFTPKNIKVGFTSEYDNASTSLKIKTATAVDTYYLEYSTGDSFYVTMSGFAGSDFMQTATPKPEVGKDYTFTISTLDANHSLPTAIEIDSGGDNYLTSGTDYTYDATSGVVVIKANQVAKDARLTVKANGEITTAAQLQAAVGGSTVATVSGNKVTMTAASTIATEERLILRGNFTLDLDAFALTFSHEKSNITINPTGALTLSGTTGGLTAHAVVSVGTSLTITSGSYDANVITADGTLTITGGTLAKGVQVYGMTGGKPTATISGGTFTDTAHGVMLYGGTLNINGGTFQKLTTAGNTGMSKLSVSGGSFASYENVNANGKEDGGTQTLADGIKAGSKVYKYDNNTKGEELTGDALAVTSYASPFMVETPSTDQKPVLTVEKYTSYRYEEPEDIIAIFANGRAVTIMTGKLITDDGTSSYNYTKLCYTDDQSKTGINLNELVKPDGVTFVGNPNDGYDLRKFWLYGGSNGENVTGNTDITVSGGIMNYVVGGGRGGVVSGTSTITVTTNMLTPRNYVVGAANGGKIEGGASLTNVYNDVYSIRGYVIDNGMSTPAPTNFTVTLGGDGGAGSAYNGRNGGGVRVSGQKDTKGVDIKTVTINPALDTNNSYVYIVFDVTPDFADDDVVATGQVGANADKYKATTLVDSEWQPTAIQNSTEIKNGTVVVNLGKADPPGHVPVTGITGVPTAATAGEDLALTGTVAPVNATNKAIVWSVKTAGDTGATITGSTLKTTAAGTVTVTATIANGQTASTPFTKDFTITVAAKPVLHVHDGMTFEPFPQSLIDGVNYIYFPEDVIGNLSFGKEKIVNLCLNGHSITAGDTLNGTIVVEGTLNIYDCNGSNGSHLITVDNTQHTITGGLVTGGSPVRGGGGGVSITAGGAMTLYGGTIAGNTVNNSAGGGVYVLGTFTMEGGAISYNTVTDGNGGGLCVGATTNTSDGSTTAVGTAILNGGTISHNTASGNGGGVRVVGAKLGDRYATLTLSGTTITDNTAAAENGVHSGGQVILDADCGNQSITWQGAPITLNAPLKAGTRIALDADGAGADTVLVTGVTTQAQADLFMITNLAPGVERFYEANAIKTRSIPTSDISGSVTDDGETPSPVSGVDVKLMKGGTGGSQVGNTVTTDSTGTFAFVGVPYGSYSLVASMGGKTITRAVAVIAQSTSAVIVMPSGNKNTKVEVTPGTPSAAADKLEEMFTQEDTEAAKTGNVEIKLVVDKKTAGDVAADATKITSALTEHQEVGAYLDAKLFKTITGTVSGNVTDELIQPPAGKTVKIVIDLPVELQNREGYVVVRVHNNVAATLAAEYDKALQTLTFEADAFSTYAVAYSVDAPTPPPVDTGSGVTTYAITATAGEGGAISPKGAVHVNRNADKTFTITPNEGFEIADVLVDGVSVGKVATYTFEKVTAKHTIEATFRRTVKNPFTDVTEDDWFHDAVLDVLEKGIMEGTGDSLFSPYLNTDRATVVTVLWRMAGKPAAKGGTTFPDVPADAWYAKAVAWATETGIVKGYDTGKFGPTDLITREQLVTLLWRYADSPLRLEYEGLTRFEDTERISQYAAHAVTWAAAEGILTGKDAVTLDPTGTATRAEVATMLMRLTAQKAEG